MTKPRVIVKNPRARKARIREGLDPIPLAEEGLFVLERG